jgi:hypothetical protein
MGDKSKTVCTCFLSFVSTSSSVFTKGHHQKAVASGFFIVSITASVLHTIVSTQDCGGVEGKRFSLTQGERLPERTTARDKQGLGLIYRHCTRQILALINKAVGHNKGRTPLWITCGLV